VRSIYADWERGDFSSAEWADPDIEFVIADGPSPGRWMGLDGLAEGVRELFSVWENVRAEADEFREIDEQRVLVLDHRSGHGKTSGLQLALIATEGGTLWQTRGGSVSNLTIYWHRDRALADLDLKE
jgi:hypothetical protein